MGLKAAYGFRCPVFAGVLVLVLIFVKTTNAALTYQECMQHANAHCSATHSTQILCVSDGRKFPNSCEFSKANCESVNVNHTSLHVTGIGSNCHSTHVVHTARPVTAAETALFSEITHDIDDRLRQSKSAGVPANEAKPIFLKQDHTHKIYERNPKCWAYSLDLTCMSPWNSNLKNRKAGTLISPRHAIWARHYKIPVNATIRFVDKDNNVVDRKVAKYRLLSVPKGKNTLYAYDIVVGVLDQDVPTTISFAKVLPRNLTDIRPTYTTKLPVLSTDKEEKALVADFSYISNSSMHGGLRTPLATSIRHDYYEPKISGDSGNPSFFVIDNQLVLLFVFTYGGAGSGTSIVAHFDEINHAMAQLGGGYQLTEIDLSRYFGLHRSIPHLIGR